MGKGGVERAYSHFGIVECGKLQMLIYKALLTTRLIIFCNLYRNFDMLSRMHVVALSIKDYVLYHSCIKKRYTTLAGRIILTRDR